MTTGVKGRLEEGGEARSAGGPGLGSAAGEFITEEGTRGSASTESIFSSFSLTRGSSSRIPAEKKHTTKT